MLFGQGQELAQIFIFALLVERADTDDQTGTDERTHTHFQNFLHVYILAQISFPR